MKLSCFTFKNITVRASLKSNRFIPCGQWISAWTLVPHSCRYISLRNKVVDKPGKIFQVRKCPFLGLGKIMPILAQKQKEIFWFYKVTIGWGQHRLVCVYVFLNNTNFGLIMHFFLPFIACDVPCDIKTKWICIRRVFLMFLTSSKTIFRTLWPLI